MAGEWVAFELVSPERLLLSRDVAMVVIPGGDGTFGVLPRHMPLVSTIKAGVIDVYESRAQVSERIFVAGGFAEVTGERCTVLAEHAVPVSELSVPAVEQEIANLREDLADSKDETARGHLAKALDVAQAKRKALEN